MKKYGIDISHHQGDIDFSKLASQVDFIILRMSYGTNNDRNFNDYYNECLKYQIPVGAYIYSYALNIDDARDEANYALDLLRDKRFDYPIYIDMEDADGYKEKNGMPSNSVLNDICNTFCSILESNNYYVGVYASKSWFDTKLTGIKDYDKWIASWGVNDGLEHSDYSNICGMFQYTSNKDILNKKMDGDVCYIDYPKIIKDRGLNGYNSNDSFTIGDRVFINTPLSYKYYVADSVKKIYGMYQVEEDINAGGKSNFNWKDNGIPEEFVDIVNKDGKKVWYSDLMHIKKRSKFVFNRSFMISNITLDKGMRYYEMDANKGNKYKFWVIGENLKK